MSNDKLEKAADNGLINRRHLLGLGLGAAGTLATSSVMAAESGLSLEIPSWSKQPGIGPSAYGKPSSYTRDIARTPANPNPLYPGGGSSRSPLHLLQGTITPNSLHFERHHSGIPDINPASHRLLINGLVRQALSFSYEDLLSYPMVSKFYFLECSGNSGTLWGNNPADGSAQSIHGLVSCAQWTGIPLSTLLDEAGVLPEARRVSAVGADAASMGRSVPLNKALDDVLIALYQNGEPVRPEQGYPMRLLVPGWEGNISVKWLTQLKLSEQPSQFRDETSKYTDTREDRLSLQFTYPMGTKSVITSPSGLMALKRHGLYQVNGIAWSGAGAIRRVEVSADGGRSWAMPCLILIRMKKP
ncbi:MAG: molybdopterin-dependent oxidoreductase [Gammaproteobacteria bacterium]|nr:molybdopterin-dependent oxidoreductase [Gammaproteobacteria bacterium]